MREPGDDRFGEISGLAELSLRGELSVEDAARLESLVLRDAEARRLYVRYMHETQTLRTWTAAKPAARKPGAAKAGRIGFRTAREKPPTPNVLAAGIAAALVIGLGLAALRTPAGKQAPPAGHGDLTAIAPGHEFDQEEREPSEGRRRTRAQVELAKDEPQSPLAVEVRQVPAPAGRPEPRTPERAADVVESAAARRTVSGSETGDRPAASSRALDRGMARIEGVSGEVHLLLGRRRSPVEEGQALIAGTGIETAAGTVRVVFPDGTRIALDPGTVVAELFEKKGKQVVLQRGTLNADVARQPAEHPLRIRTHHAEATVLGTTLRLAADEQATLLAVSEGRVRLSRPSQRGSIEVTSGQQAVAAAGGGMWTGPSRLKEIVILSDQARLVGSRWHLVQDALAIGGRALEAPQVLEMEEGREIFRRGEDYAEFVFPADADVTYHVWIRGRCMATDRQIVRDAVTMVPLQARYVGHGSWLVLPDRLGIGFNGFSHEKAYGWIGGDADASGPNGPRGDTVPTSVRFDRSGLQRLRLVPFEGPIRVDAVWLSASQETRPAREQKGPR